MTFILPRFEGTFEGEGLNSVVVNIVLRQPNGETIRERRFYPVSEMDSSQRAFDTTLGKDGLFRYDGPNHEKGRYRLKVQAGRPG